MWVQKALRTRWTTKISQKGLAERFKVSAGGRRFFGGDIAELSAIQLDGVYLHLYPRGLVANSTSNNVEWRRDPTDAVR